MRVSELPYYETAALSARGVIFWRFIFRLHIQSGSSQDLEMHQLSIHRRDWILQP